MNSLTTAEGHLLLHPALPTGAELPAHLHGSRAAIFHLLRGVPAPTESVQPRSSTLPALIKAHPACAEKQAPPLSRRSTGWQVLFQEDHFDFHFGDARSAAMRSPAMRSVGTVVS